MQREIKLGSELRRAAALAVSAILAIGAPVWAGGPLHVGGPSFGVDGQPFRWDTATPVAYRVDGGPLSVTPTGTVVIDRTSGVAMVQSMFQVWEDVATAAIRYTNAGPVHPAGSFSDGDASVFHELLALETDCEAGNQSPIVFDADGTIVDQLIGDPGVIGFAGTCKFDTTAGRIASALALLNGRLRDGISTPSSVPPNFELTAEQFQQAFVHEFGHFSGLDHSQINVAVLSAPRGNCGMDDLAGLPVMFPFVYCQARTVPGVQLPALAPDDLAWISWLYPETANTPPAQIPFSSAYGTISGTISFSDGLTQAQGVNVVARRISDGSSANGDETKRIAFSVVSGFRFAGNLGQNVSGTNPGDLRGSRDPQLAGRFEIPVTPGTYTVQVESINPAFAFGSRVGPLDPPVPNPGPNEFWDANESATDNPITSSTITVTAGGTVSNIDVILNGTPPRIDMFESAKVRLPEILPAWLRRHRTMRELAAG